ncbi:hypothetical protein EMPS_05401 [Entomortierella parvispora]|uniref:L domain-like protein n=1 Tax=Entomortierella parvispora TaxID=205924 RepID=A0A9P3LWG1_9FUNG|nr:hypothetical protein EMPS_05401 [Entomortierella parvispora]
MSVQDNHHRLPPPPPLPSLALPPLPPRQQHQQQHAVRHHPHSHRQIHSQQQPLHYTKTPLQSPRYLNSSSSSSPVTPPNHMASSTLVSTSGSWTDSTLRNSLHRLDLDTDGSLSMGSGSREQGSMDASQSGPRQSSMTSGSVLHLVQPVPIHSPSLSFVQSNSHTLAPTISLTQGHDGPVVVNIHGASSNKQSAMSSIPSSFGPSSSSTLSFPPLAQKQKSSLPSLVPPASLSDPFGSQPSRRPQTTISSSLSSSSSFSSSLMAKKTPASNPYSNPSSPTSPKHATASVDTIEEVMDIESCIDNPVLAPLGRHVNKRRSPKRIDKDHIDINVVRPTSSSTFIQEQDRESHAPVTSLILRRRRLDCEQLERYLQNLQPSLDPQHLEHYLQTLKPTLDFQAMSVLQSPLLHLTEMDLSRNKLERLPGNITSLVPHLVYLNLSHNQFTEIPLQLCRLSQLQVLIMSQNRIEGPVPFQICSSLTQLKTLRLCANQITSLPYTMARLEKLESLSMGSVYGGNLLTSFPKDCIQYMGALRELDLSHNKLCFLPSDIGHPGSHLRQLVASDNKLEAIPKSIGMCKELRSLNLGRNQLTSLPTEIADLKQLDTLDLSENLLCVIPGDVADFLTKTTLLLTGNPFTRGYCDANRNPISEIGGLGINYPTDEDRYAAVLKSLSRRAILNSAASSSSSGHVPTLASLAAGSGRESPRPPTSTPESGYEMDQDERLDYHLYYTRHALSSRPPSRAESMNSLNEGYSSDYSGSWMDQSRPSTPRVHAEAVISDIDSFFDYIPSLASSSTNITTAAISPGVAAAEPTIFDGAGFSTPTALLLPQPIQTSPTAIATPLVASPVSSQGQGQSFSSAMEQLSLQEPPASSSTSVSPLLGSLPATTTTPTFFPTLRELAARAVLHRGQPLPLEYIPEQVIDYLEPGARPCGFCRRPYVKEWVSSVRVKSYLGHPAVARRVRFCSSSCWRKASEQLEAEEAGGPSTPSSSSAFPGPLTGHLPPVIATSRGCNEDGESCKGGVPEEDDFLDGSPPGSVPTSPRRSAASHGMRTCKGGQTYWPVIGRRPRSWSSSSAPASSSGASSASLPLPETTTQGTRQHTMDASGTLTPTNVQTDRETGVCSGGCLGGGVCEW